MVKEILEKLGNDSLVNIANQVGAPKEKVSTAIEGILPILLGAMSKNVASKDGASGLLNALDKDHSGDIFSNLSGLLSNPDAAGASGILKHILGSNQAQVEQALGAKTGLQSNQVSGIMKSLALMVMRYLGSQKKQINLNAVNIGSILAYLNKSSDKSTDLDLGSSLIPVGAVQDVGKPPVVGYFEYLKNHIENNKNNYV
jgi:hypothetical protein